MRLFILLICLFPSLLFSQDMSMDTIQHDGLDRSFVTHIPSYYDGSTQMPIVFNFHGFGSNAFQQFIYGDFRSIAEEEGFILVHPQGTLIAELAHWNVGGFTSGSTVDDVGFTLAMIEFLTDKYNVDESRIYATGMSNGGYMSYLLACQLGDKFAAIASVTGSMTPEIYDDCNPTHPTPVMQIHGTDDATVPYNGADFSYAIDEVMDYWINYNNCDKDPQLIEIEDTNSADASTVSYFIFSECDNNITTELFRINGGFHTWPGAFFGGAGTNQDIDASEQIWKFFSRHDINGVLATSVEDNSLTTSVNVYPNPTNKLVNIESSSIQDFQIYNLLGKEMMRGSLSLGVQTLDLDSFDDGTYLLKTKTKSIKIQLIR